LVTTPTAFRGVGKPTKDNLLQWAESVQTVVNQILVGRLNVVGTVTLTANVATTTVLDTRVGNDSAIPFMPTTANAAAEIGAGTMYVSTRTAGTSFVITHANNAQTDRIFVYCIIG